MAQAGEGSPASASGGRSAPPRRRAARRLEQARSSGSGAARRASRRIRRAGAGRWVAPVGHSAGFGALGALGFGEGLRWHARGPCSDQIELAVRATSASPTPVVARHPLAGAHVGGARHRRVTTSRLAMP